MMIRTENLSKRFGDVVAVKDLNLEVRKGTAYGFIGPNGAGKSTTMAMLATLLEPSEGRAWIGGWEVTEHPDEVRRLIGYMPDFFGVYDRLTAEEYLAFFAAGYGIDPSRREGIISRLLELVNLADKRDAYVDDLSRGMKQRLGLARCLVHDPELLILDEPASGLDPRARIELRSVLRELKSMGKTIFISSHILPELADFCDAIGVMERGKLVAAGDVREITGRIKGGRTVEIHLLEDAERAAKRLEGEQGVTSLRVDGRKLTVGLEGDERRQAELLSLLIAEGIPVYRFEEISTDIEDVFLKITGTGEEGSP
ncbi:ABC-2 type transport system ATP-binding protein [Planifilum fimeticola]|uniref:ABC-2 type transport system ATP-binding protein n=2 Tax=Planifilum fimeticola TaxID=201975 RepID=A0A2T0LCG2_9BACL|nr:ABC-2 type transport system ATP-binding protein [Planifilum fimeticola]